MTNEDFRKCHKLGFNPIRLILGKGELLFIPKGRLHAFRKAAPFELPTTDCHYHLHHKLLANLKKSKMDVFPHFSFTWDWLHVGSVP